MARGVCVFSRAADTALGVHAASPEWCLRLDSPTETWASSHEKRPKRLRPVGRPTGTVNLICPLVCLRARSESKEPPEGILQKWSPRLNWRPLWS